MRMASCRQSVLVAIKELGLPHAPWMWRQVASMSSLDLHVMYWMLPGMKEAPTTTAPVHIVNADPTPYDGKGRWQYRLANLSTQNFYSALGEEYREIKKLIQSVQP